MPKDLLGTCVSVSLLKSLATVGGYTAISRVLGMIREMLMSHVIGAGVVADAFIVAFKFPNFFRRFFAEGAFHAAFVPQFAGTLAHSGKKAALQLAERVFTLMAIFLLLLVVCVELFTPTLIPVIAPGFATTAERLDLAISYTRFTFPYILFISLCALCVGVLNSVNRFAAGAAAPILLNIIMITALVSYSVFDLSPGTALSISVLIAGFLQLGWMMIVCKRAGYTFHYTPPRLTPDVKKVFRLMLPAAFSAGVMQVNLLIDMMLASLLPVGAMSYLYYADRLNQLPLSIFGIAMGTALLPPLSKLWKNNQREKALITQEKAFVFSLVLTLPATVGLILLSTPFIALIFGHGHFTQNDVFATSPTLAALAFGLPAYVAGKVFSTAFFAQENTKTPLYVAIVCVVVNIILNLIFMRLWAHVGMALATSVAAWVNVALLAWALMKRKAFQLTGPSLFLLSKTIGATTIMGSALYMLQRYIPYQTETLWQEIVCTGVYMAGGLFTYGLSLFLLKANPLAFRRDI